ncbi:MAG: hypothetical protein AAGE43_08220 [Pseudomonadota bacterium]
MGDVEEEFEEETEDGLDADDAEELGEDEEMEDLEDELDDDLDDETASEMKAVDEALSPKEQSARSLAIRRALEQRAEEKRLHDDLDYLDD